MQPCVARAQERARFAKTGREEGQAQILNSSYFLEWIYRVHIPEYSKYIAGYSKYIPGYSKYIPGYSDFSEFLPGKDNG
jgi:hypothetical protein